MSSESPVFLEPRRAQIETAEVLWTERTNFGEVLAGVLLTQFAT